MSTLEQLLEMGFGENQSFVYIHTVIYTLKYLALFPNIYS